MIARFQAAIRAVSVAALVSAACLMPSADPHEDGAFRCETQDDCLAGYACRNGRCSRPPNWATGEQPPPGWYCSNNKLEEGEECDDGNLVDGDGCDSNCMHTRCGNGILNRGELCDDGVDNGLPNRCNSTCAGTTSPVCGNGVQEAGELCDDGVDNGLPNRCNSTCAGTTSPVCGNGVQEAGEACDDGANGDPCDECLDDCTSHLGTCGDGYTCGDEACDDGANGDPCDECLDDCTSHLSTCGDGYTCGDETCDDGANGDPCDECLDDCTSHANICGDGYRCGDEVCDEGEDNGEPNGCSAGCDGLTPSVCGNGVQEAGEACDDGRTNACGSCNADCTGSGTGAACTGEEALYVVTSYQDVYTVDVATGAATFVGSLGFGQNSAISLASRPGSEVLVTFARGGPGTTAGFYDVDPFTAEPTLFGGTGTMRASISGLAYDSRGTLFGIDAGSDDLAIYHPTTDEKDIIGPTSFPYGGGLDFDSSGQLFAVAEARDLVTLDTSTGDSTVLGRLGTLFLGIAFAPDDTLYTTQRINMSRSDLYRVHPLTAETTFVATITGFRRADDTVARMTFAPRPSE